MKILVSLTSHPERIENVHKVIKTLLIQNKRPDAIFLWLSKTQFVREQKDLPYELLKLVDYGLKVRWCDDLKPHKKYFYIMQEFPNDIIITVDDDAYYSPRLIETLYNSFLKYPDAVSCTLANRIVIAQDGKTTYKQWEKNYRKCCDEKVFDLLPVGIGGILYPPHCMPKEAFDKEIINATCLFQDDLWLKAMEIKHDIPTVLVSKGEMLVDMMEEGIECGLYNTINKTGNDIAFSKISEQLDLQTGERNFLIKKLSNAKNSIKNILDFKNEDKEKAEKHFLKIIKNKKLVIYGAGIGAHLVMESLLSFDKLIRPYAFIVTDKTNNPTELFDINVLGVDELLGNKDEYFIIVSTAEKLHKEIEIILRRLNYNHIVFIKDKVMGKILQGQKNILEAHDIFIYSLMEKIF